MNSLLTAHGRQYTGIVTVETAIYRVSIYRVPTSENPRVII